MADIDTTFNYDADFSSAISEVQKLAREVSLLNAQFNAFDKAAIGVKRDFADAFRGGIGEFAGLRVEAVNLSHSIDDFGKALDKSKLKLRDYAKEARNAFKENSNARKLAEDQVRRTKATLVELGMDASGNRRGMLVTPMTLDLSNMQTQLEVAKKQWDIFNKLVQDGSTHLINWGKNTQWAGRQLTVGLTVPMTMFASTTIKAFNDVDAELTRFQKVYGSSLVQTTAAATDAIRKQVQAVAVDIAKTYGIAAKETAALSADLAATGLEGQKLIDSIKQTTRLSVLGELDRQDAMKTTLSLQNAFNMSTKQLAESIDFLNAVENQTSVSLGDLSEAIPKVGPVVRALGGDVKDLSVLLVAMKEGGINAAEGANALKSGLASLINPTKNASEVAKQYGIDLEMIVEKNKGKLLPTVLEFQKSLSVLDELGKAKVIEQIFGKYQFARISALFDNLNQQGSQTRQVIELMGKSSKDLANIANAELKTLTESTSMKFKRSLEGIKASLLPLGETIARSVIPFMDKLSSVLDKIISLGEKLPGPVKSFLKFAAGLTAIAGPIIMITGVLGNFLGYIIKGAMAFVNLGRKMAGLPTEQFSMLSADQIAATKATNDLVISIERQKQSMLGLNDVMRQYSRSLANALATQEMLFQTGAVLPENIPPSARPITPPPGRRPPRRQRGGSIFRAQGGGESWVPGYGEGDKVSALLEPGEFVINKKAAKKHKKTLEYINYVDAPRFQSGGNVAPFRAMSGKNVPRNRFAEMEDTILARAEQTRDLQQRKRPPGGEGRFARKESEFKGAPVQNSHIVDQNLFIAIAKSRGLTIPPGTDSIISDRFVGQAAMLSGPVNSAASAIQTSMSGGRLTWSTAERRLIRRGYPTTSSEAEMLLGMIAKMEMNGSSSSAFSEAKVQLQQIANGTRDPLKDITNGLLLSGTPQNVIDQIKANPRQIQHILANWMIDQSMAGNLGLYALPRGSSTRFSSVADLENSPFAGLKQGIGRAESFHVQRAIDLGFKLQRGGMPIHAQSGKKTYAQRNDPKSYSVGRQLRSKLYTSSYSGNTGVDYRAQFIASKIDEFRSGKISEDALRQSIAIAQDPRREKEIASFFEGTNKGHVVSPVLNRHGQAKYLPGVMLIQSKEMNAKIGKRTVQASDILNDFLNMESRGIMPTSVLTAAQLATGISGNPLLAYNKLKDELQRNPSRKFKRGTKDFENFAWGVLKNPLGDLGSTMYSIGEVRTSGKKAPYNVSGSPMITTDILSDPGLIDRVISESKTNRPKPGPGMASSESLARLQEHFAKRQSGGTIRAQRGINLTRAAYKPINKAYELINYLKMRKAVKRGLYHGAYEGRDNSPIGLPFDEDYMSGMITDRNPGGQDVSWGGMQLFSTSSRQEAMGYATNAGFNSTRGEYSTVFKLGKVPYGKYISLPDLTQIYRNKALKRQSYDLWRYLQDAGASHTLFQGMEQFGIKGMHGRFPLDISGGAGMQGKAGRDRARWGVFADPRGVHLKDIGDEFGFQSGGIVRAMSGFPNPSSEELHLALRAWLEGDPELFYSNAYDPNRGTVKGERYPGFFRDVLESKITGLGQRHLMRAETWSRSRGEKNKLTGVYPLLQQILETSAQSSLSQPFGAIGTSRLTSFTDILDTTELKNAYYPSLRTQSDIVKKRLQDKDLIPFLVEIMTSDVRGVDIQKVYNGYFRHGNEQEYVLQGRQRFPVTGIGQDIATRLPMIHSIMPGSTKVIGGRRVAVSQSGGIIRAMTGQPVGGPRRPYVARGLLGGKYGAYRNRSLNNQEIESFENQIMASVMGYGYSEAQAKTYAKNLLEMWFKYDQIASEIAYLGKDKSKVNEAMFDKSYAYKQEMERRQRYGRQTGGLLRAQNGLTQSQLMSTVPINHAWNYIHPLQDPQAQIHSGIHGAALGRFSNPWGDERVFRKEYHGSEESGLNTLRSILIGHGSEALFGNLARLGYESTAGGTGLTAPEMMMQRDRYSQSGFSSVSRPVDLFGYIDDPEQRAKAMLTSFLLGNTDTHSGNLTHATSRRVPELAPFQLDWGGNLFTNEMGDLQTQEGVKKFVSRLAMNQVLNTGIPALTSRQAGSHLSGIIPVFSDMALIEKALQAGAGPLSSDLYSALGSFTREYAQEKDPVKYISSLIKQRGQSMIAHRQAGGNIGFDATSAWVPGSGEGDKIKALLEPGEFVVNKVAAKKHGGMLNYINYVDAPRFQSGGAANPQPTFSTKKMVAEGVLSTLMFQFISLVPGLEKLNSTVQMVVSSIASVLPLIAMQKFGGGSSIGSGIVNTFGKGKVLREQARREISIGRQMIDGASTAASRRGAMAGAGRAATGFGRVAAGAGRLAVGALMSPAGLAVAATVGVAALAWKKYQDEIKKAKKASEEAFTAGKDTAAMYGVQIAELNDKIKENQKLSKDLKVTNSASTAVVTNKMSQDKIDVIKSENENLISTLKKESQLSAPNIGQSRYGITTRTGLADRQKGLLITKFATLRQQGFSQQDAMEVITQIAKESGDATLSQLQSIRPELEKMAGDNATEVFKAAQEAQLNALKGTKITSAAGSSEGFREAFKGAMDTIQYAAPQDQLEALNSLIDNMSSFDSTQLVQAGKAISEAAKASYGSDSSITKTIDALVGKGDTKSLQNATALDAALKGGLDSKVALQITADNKLTDDEMLLINNFLKERDQKAQLKVDIQATTDKKIEEITKQAEKDQKIAQDKINSIEAQAEAENVRYEKAQKHHTEFIKSTQKEIDEINKGTDAYLEGLQKRQVAEDYYKQQSQTSLGGLSALAGGDVFGFVQAQQQLAVGAQQFGFEQQIAQIEERRKAAVEAKQEEINKEQELASTEEERHNNRLKQLSDQRDSIAKTAAAQQLAAQAAIDAYSSLSSESGAAFSSLTDGYTQATIDAKGLAASQIAVNYLATHTNATVEEAIAEGRKFLDQNKVATAGTAASREGYLGTSSGSTSAATSTKEARGGGSVVSIGGKDNKKKDGLASSIYESVRSRLFSAPYPAIGSKNTYPDGSKHTSTFRYPIDYSAGMSTPIRAMFSGTVTANDLGNASYGKYITLSSDSGNGTAIYAHLSRISKTGKVAAGDIIGATGNTGNSTGPHLHFEWSQMGFRPISDLSKTDVGMPSEQIESAFGVPSGAIDRLKAAGIASALNIKSIFGYGGRRAIGGSMTMNKPYLVGENGPEVVMPYGFGGKVAPIKYNMPRIAQGGIIGESSQTGNISIHVNGVNDPNRAAERAVQLLEQKARRRDFNGSIR